MHRPYAAYGHPHFCEQEEALACVLVKLEKSNPFGSVKDRAALYIIRELEKAGRLTPGGCIVELTSGNTGVGLAAIGACRGYRVVLTMPASMSQERRMLLAALGAELVLTPAEAGMQGAIDKADELVKAIPGAVLAGQFVNPANVKAHYETTGPELWQQTDGRIDCFCSRRGHRRHHHGHWALFERAEPTGAYSGRRTVGFAGAERRAGGAASASGHWRGVCAGDSGCLFAE